MIERYSRPPMAGLWSDEAKFASWLQVEILAVEARVKLGEVSEDDLEQIKQKATFDVERIHDLERKTRHDVAAFVDNVAESIGPAGRHIHYGMTSSDVLDTGLALQMRKAADVLIEGLDQLIEKAVGLARTHARTLMVFRTHGIHAEPGSFGLKAASWAQEVSRARQRLYRARGEVSVGKLSGAVGTYSQLPPEVEAFVCERLELEPDPTSTQVVSRDRHAFFLSSLGVAAATIERMAVEIRHLARTEVGEVEEHFAAGEQKGSSAMPHKRNPVRTERLTGLARYVRATVSPALENVALWHERDISHSSAERIVIPDACIALDFMIHEAIDVLGDLKVNPERMRSNLQASFGLVFSQSVLLALVDAGLERGEAYRIVQEAASEAWESKTHLKQVLASHPEASKHLDGRAIEGCFDETRYLRHVDEIIARLEDLNR